MAIANVIKALNRWINDYFEHISMMTGYAAQPSFIKSTILSMIGLSLVSLVLALLSIRLMPKLTILFALIEIVSLLMITMSGIYLVAKVRSRAGKFEKAIVTILLTTIPLLASGEPLVNVMNHLTMVRMDPEVAGEFRRIVAEVYGGFDIVNAIRRSINRVPSRTYSDVMSIITESYGISNNIADILMLKLDSIIRREQSTFKSKVQTLSLMMEIYLVSVQLLPLLLIILAISLSPLGSFPINPTALILLLFLVYMPITGMVFYVVMSGLTD